MSEPPPLAEALPTPETAAGGDPKASCAAIYAHPAVRWLLGGELHPGGEATTRRALKLARVGPGDRLLDVASGTGTSSLLAARELGCRVAGIEYGPDAVRGARAAAAAAGLESSVSFEVGDAEALPFADGEFDAALCECSLCTFPDKGRAVAEIGRVLRPGGRLALCDVTADGDRLSPRLRGSLATLACVGEALSADGYRRLLEQGGLRVIADDDRRDDAAALAERVEDRLRGARLLGLDRLEGSPLDIDAALELVGEAREAIAAGSLGYSIFAAVR